ncbi:hypothetical protein KCTC32516_00796 [Polaribacter huanghezhanensis]|uniref:DUF4837 family protein n=1 Tax=Polaribacter huanghezhanensis TaxID=1354726 RepID=UPI002648D249|nr:DUF4837 family protein [Polaribacter huanghezhanensis]WKD85455.1 hypothetical protein KCTC32516_00796 [Polaribacter huanghezhanensis]
MKKGFTIIALLLFFTSCKNPKDTFVLSSSVGQSNQLLVVTDASDWSGKVGDNLREFLGKLVVGLPQPETTFSVTQIAPKGFGSMMNKYRNILFVQIAENESFRVQKDFYARPQTLVYVTAKDKEGLNEQLDKHKKEIVKIFRDSEIKHIQQRFYSKKVDVSKYKTLEKLGLSLIIPTDFRTVEDTGDFLWLRQRIMSGIARGDGTSNILVYSVPLTEEFDFDVNNEIIKNRNAIGEEYIPGSKEGMYMITEAAFTPQTLNAVIDNKKAFETRGKWEVKNDFMAGPFLNYTVVDKKNNRLIVFEGFTYAPSVDKRDFIFDLEAIGKSLKIK